MLITVLKPNDEILSLVGKRTVAIVCSGCQELDFPENDVPFMLDDMVVDGTVSAVIKSVYVCSPALQELYINKHIRKIETADTLLVFSCGVGMQNITKMLTEKGFKIDSSDHGLFVHTACDTLTLPGNQGVTPSEFNCIGCDSCHLNETAGICPVTACSKCSTNGQCGGSKNGKCEVDKDMDCAWEKITARLERFKG